MSMMDFQSALAGAPPGAGGGLPPEAAGGLPPGPPPPGAEEAGMPPPEGEEEAPQFTSSLEALDAAEDALHAFVQLDPDEADRAVAARCLEQVIKLKAANQQSVQSGDLKSLQRALSGGAGY